MSSSISVGGALEVVDKLLELYSDLNGGPDELRVAKPEIEQIRGLLDLAKTNLDKERWRLASTPQSKLIFERLLEPLNGDLLEVQEALHAYVEYVPVTTTEKVEFAMLFKTHLQDLSRAFGGYVKSLESIITLLAPDHRYARKATTNEKRLDDQLSKQTLEATLRQEIARKRKQWVLMMRTAMKSFQTAASHQEENHHTPAQVLDQLATNLIKLGASTEKAESVRSEAGQVLLEQFTMASLRKFVPAVESDDCKILCLGSSYSADCALAQTYLETLRAYAAMCSPWPSRWLFERVDAASFDADHSSEKRTIHERMVIERLISSCQSDNTRTMELGMLGKRMLEYETLSFKPSDLADYHYILASPLVVDKLQEMWEAVRKENPSTPLARIVELEHCWSYESVGVLILNVKAALHKFLGQRPFYWSHQEPGAGTPFRMLQYDADVASLRCLDSNGADPRGDQQLLEMEKTFGCTIETNRSRARNRVVVSIIGPETKIVEARKSLMKS